MAHCSNCGVELEGRAKFCYNCGEPVGAGGGSAGPARTLDKVPTTSRSFTRGFLVSNIGLGLVFQFFGLIFVLAPPFSATGVGFGALILGVGIASVATGYGIAKSLPWGRLSGALSGFGYLATGLLLSFDIYLLPLGIAGVVLGAATFYHLFFGPRADAPNVGA